MKFSTSTGRGSVNSITIVLFSVFALVVLGGVGMVVFLSNINNNLRPAQQAPSSPEIPVATSTEEAERLIPEVEALKDETSTEIVVKNIVSAAPKTQIPQDTARLYLTQETPAFTYDDAYIINTIRHVRVEAELSYDDNSRSYANVCIDMAGYFGELAEISMPNCDDSATQYAIDVQLSTGEYYCIDSTGFADVVAKTKGDTSITCPKL
jgi:hypothetical protein